MAAAEKSHGMKVHMRALAVSTSALLALVVVGLFVHGRVMEELRIRDLSSPDLETREAAASRLASVRCWRAAPVLLQALAEEKDPSYYDREPRYLFHSLEQLACEKTVPAFCAALGRGPVEFRSWVAGVLGRMGPGSAAAFDALRGALPGAGAQLDESDAKQVREAAAHALAGFGRKAVEPLAASLSQRSCPPACAIALGVIGPNARAAEERLEAAIGAEFEDREVHGAALWALGEMGLDPVEVLERKLSGSDAGARAAAVLLATRLGEQARGLLPALARIAAGPDPAAGDLLRDVLGAMHRIEGTGSAALGAAVRILDERPNASAREGAWHFIANDFLEAGGQARVDGLEDRIRKAFADPSPEVRKDAVSALKKLGRDAIERAIPLLLPLLDDPEPRVSSGVMRTLGDNESDALLAALLRRLDWGFDLDVARELSRFGPRAGRALPILERTLEQIESSMRMDLAPIIDKIEPGNQAALSTVLAGLRSKDWRLSRSAAFVLGRLGGPREVRRTALWEAAMIQGPNGSTEACCQALGFLCKDQFAFLLEHARGLDALAHRRALNALCSIAFDKSGLETLIGFLSDPEPELRAWAACAIGYLRADAAPALPALAALVRRDTDEAILVQVIGALGRIGPGAAPSVPALSTVLDDAGAHGSLAEHTALALGRIGRPAVPALCRALEHREWSVRYQALKGLELVGKDADGALPALRKALDDCEDAYGPAYVLYALAEIGPGTAPLASRIAQFLHDPSLHDRCAAVEALKAIGPAAAGAAPALAVALSDPDWDFCALVEAALLDLGDLAAPAAPALVEQLVRGRERHRASRILSRIGTPAVPPLRAALEKADGELGVWIVFTLGRMGAAAEGATGAIERLLGSRDELLSLHAREALAKVSAKDAELTGPRMLRLSDLVPEFGCGVQGFSDGGPDFWHRPDRCVRSRKP